MSSHVSLITNTPISVLLKNPSNFHKGLVFLWKLAWKSRLRLSYLIIAAFMILDIHMTLEVRVDVGRDDFYDAEHSDDDEYESDDESDG